jgi:hypothetical protein
MAHVVVRADPEVEPRKKRAESHLFRLGQLKPYTARCAATAATITAIIIIKIVGIYII